MPTKKNGAEAPLSPVVEEPAAEPILEPSHDHQPLRTNAQHTAIGNIVHYVLDSGHHRGEHRPAVVLNAWGKHPDEFANLLVLTDGANDFPPGSPGHNPPFLHKTSVRQDEIAQMPNYWHAQDTLPPKG